MPFFESPAFPMSLRFGAIGGPEFDTAITRTLGREYADAQRQYPLQKYDAAPAIRTPAQYNEALGYFMVMRGMWGRFRFRDRLDNCESDGNATGVVTSITSTTFQMVKRYAAGSITLDRPIKKPVAETVTVYVSGAATSAFTLDATTGILTIGSAPAANTVTWRGTFDVPARFGVDYFPASTVSRTADGFIVQVDSLPILEVPL